MSESVTAPSAEVEFHLRFRTLTGSVCCDHQKPPKFVTQNIFQCDHCEGYQHLRCCPDKRRARPEFGADLCNPCVEAARARLQQEASSVNPALAPAAPLTVASVQPSPASLPPHSSTAYLPGRVLPGSLALGSSGSPLFVNSGTVSPSAEAFAKANPLLYLPRDTRESPLFVGSESSPDQEDAPTAGQKTRVSSESSEQERTVDAEADHRVSTKGPVWIRLGTSSDEDELLTVTQPKTADSRQAVSKQTVATDTTYSSPSPSKTDMHTRASEEADNEREARRNRIRELISGSFWESCCAQPSFHATDAVKEATKAEFSFEAARMVPVHKAPKSWVDEVEVGVIKMLEAVDPDKARELMDAEKNSTLYAGNVLKPWREEGVRLVNRGSYKRKRAELGLLLEILGLEQKGKFWKGEGH